MKTRRAASAHAYEACVEGAAVGCCGARDCTASTAVDARTAG